MILRIITALNSFRIFVYIGSSIVTRAYELATSMCLLEFAYAYIYVCVRPLCSTGKFLNMPTCFFCSNIQISIGKCVGKCEKERLIMLAYFSNWRLTTAGLFCDRFIFRASETRFLRIIYYKHFLFRII